MDEPGEELGMEDLQRRTQEYDLVLGTSGREERKKMGRGRIAASVRGSRDQIGDRQRWRFEGIVGLG